VNVVLVEPFRSEHGADPDARRRTLDFWREYFRARGNSNLIVRTLDNSDMLVPMSVVSEAATLARAKS